MSVGAKDSEADSQKMPDEYGEMLDGLDSDVRERLPDELFSDSLEDVAQGSEKLASPSYLLPWIKEILTENVKKLVGIFVFLFAAVLCSALGRGVGGAVGTSGVSSAFSFVVGIAICISVFSAMYGSLSIVLAYIKTLSSLMNATLPLMTTLYLMGGNVGQAALSNASLTAFLGVSENIVGRTIIPFSSVCMALSAASSFDGGINLGAIGNVVKRTYTTIISLVAFFLSAVLGIQSTLASRADTLAMKGVKFLSSNMIPVVGAAVGEGIRTASASVSYIRSAVGTIALVSLLLAFFSVFSYLLILRFALNLSSSVADVLGCGPEKNILSEMASIVGHTLAAISLCTLTFIFALTIFIKCACAV